MAKNKSQVSPAAIVLAGLAMFAALLGFLALSPTGPEPTGESPGSGDGGGAALEFEFYNRLQQNEVQVNSASGESPAVGGPGPDDIHLEAQVDSSIGEPVRPDSVEIGQLAEQLIPDIQAPLPGATETLEQIAETIVAGLEVPAPDRTATRAPEPASPAPAEPRSPAATVLVAPVPASVNAASRRGAAAVLQSGAFRQQELALSELERQRNLGLEVEIRQRPGQNGPMFLLQSGPYDSRYELEEAELVFRLHNIATARLATP